MKVLIKKVIEDSNLIIKELTYQDLNTIFAYFEKQDDFFIFIFATYSQLKKSLEIEQNKDIEYALNAYVVGYKAKFLQEYKERSIDYNFSLILVLEEDIEIPKLDFIEENPFNSKKYILQYNRTDLEILEHKINEEQIVKPNIIHSLNTLTTKNSDLLKEKKDGSLWYDLLLRLFIKIPFLNYEVLDDDKVEELKNLEEVIFSKLNETQTKILKEILSVSDSIDLEKLISKITHITSEDE